jgi:ATP-dependent Clp protease ATP-binding subunit ClpA
MGPQATELAQEAFRRGLDETRRLNHDSVRAEHILLGVLQLSAGSASAALDAASVDRIAISRRLEELLPPGEAPPHPGEYPYHASGMALIRKVFPPPPGDQASKLTSGRVLLGLLSLDHGPIVEAMADAGVDRLSLVERLNANADE